MTLIKIHGWDKKPRTALRGIKVGDIFLLSIDGESYAAGRVLSKVDIGHGVEFFDLLLPRPEITASEIAAAQRAGTPVFVDSYGLFDRKIEGDWRIVGHDDGFAPREESTYFSYGAGQYWRVDIFGAEEEVSQKEAEKYPSYSPQGDAKVKQWLVPLLHRGR